MKRVMDQTILLLYCMAVLLLVPVQTSFVIALLAAIIYDSVIDFLDGEKWNRILTVVILVTAFFCPELLLFLPVILYGLLERKKYPSAIGLSIITLGYWAMQDPRVLCYLVLGCILAAWMQYKEEHYEHLEQNFRKIRDDGTERNLLLKEKNQKLLKQQDYEIYTATLKERNRIAREIHDNVGHMLSRSILMVGAMKAVNQEAKMKELLGQLEDTLNAAMTSVRESVHDLYDESVNLGEVLKSLAEEFSFCPVGLEYDMGYDIPRDIKYCFIAIVKEALNNVMKHSDAVGVHILAREHPGLYQIVVEDNGSISGRGQSDGWRNSPVKEQGRGIGIRNMQERVMALGGTIQIQRVHGFRIYITIPKRQDGIESK